MEMAANRKSSKRIRTRNTIDVVDESSSNNGGGVIEKRRLIDIPSDLWEPSNNGGGVIEKRCLLDIPSDLWEPIMSKLFFIDQINFHAVCKLWHSFNNVPPLKQMPWLMVFSFNDSKDRWWSYSDDREYKNISWNSCKLIDPTYNKTYTIDMSSIEKKKDLNNKIEREIIKDCSVKIHESKYGWLLMSRDSCEWNQNPTSSSLFLYSPFFIDNNIIELPPVLSVHEYYIATFDLIWNPSSKKKKEEADGFEVLFLISYKYGTICIKTYRLGDNSWSCNQTNWTNWNYDDLDMIKCWVYSEGIFYYAIYPTHLEKGSDLGSYDIARNKWTKFPTLEPVRPTAELHMTHSDGKIHLISVNETQQTWGLMHVYIYKLNLSKGIWEPIEKLGDRALFLGNRYSSILELDDDIEELKDQRQKVYYSYGSFLKHGNALGKTRSYACTKDYGSFTGQSFCRRLWIDPPCRIRNTLQASLI